MKAGSNHSDGAAGTGSAVIVFDGVCALCNRWVRFLLRFDRKGRYRFAAMQGQQGSAMLRAHGLDPQDPMSFLLLDAQGTWTDTDAILRVLAGLGGGWRLSGVLKVLPRGLRDAAYRALARNRYRWFGRHDACHLPAPEQAARFLD
ncbi:MULTISPECIES: thiol-disulfide oxidoreductase DCC family protein [Stenotrophomonas]|jgi:predicted DCC family thiol-disulfide oxidoreductase YuxK|uniref:thiol-disulfide oxidoreductase DCC family protein n=1 Tax=Stenotrophomonas TaxID=40323 RepID=UPI000DA9C55C|nr:MULTISPECIES: thiol-disulfide oxidoreductase DCC family protein [Stenotrophomonas]MBH1367838.1 thiol-disulfide oxidoreductase DCC family protein [Stenotrophomonas maltophilia]MBH1435388.1 thiol-disulfide oxidoreductase DCC family protein [Stenotrophomonas maltophilia]MBH1510329.1 thiol-disulfide oxidoreductase DCC family protein [Stenotrophomonas maltophilia]MBH1546990.1 thiol-disulfide oxidoreductase DCC family protein [Stenotrophomonas maltophilia]MBH1832414.1 thiol-disulfide oxidoreducta